MVNGTSFAIQDPMFGLDISYYIFQKPVIETFILYYIIFLVALSLYMALYYVIVFNRYFDGVEGNVAPIKNEMLAIANDVIFNDENGIDNYMEYGLDILVEGDLKDGTPVFTRVVEYGDEDEFTETGDAELDEAEAAECECVTYPTAEELEIPADEADDEEKED